MCFVSVSYANSHSLQPSIFAEIAVMAVVRIDYYLFDYNLRVYHIYAQCVCTRTDGKLSI